MTSPEKTRRPWATVVCLLLIVLLVRWMVRRFLVTPPKPPVVQETPTPAAPPTPIVAAPPEVPTIKAPAPATTVHAPKKITSAKKPPPVKKPVVPATLPLVATVPAAPPPVFVPPPLPLEPREWQGNDTSVTHVGQVVIHNDRQWIHFWSEHHPHEAAPDVDFTRDMVIGVFAGPRPAEQFTIRIVDARTLPTGIVVDYVEKLPPVGTFAVNVTVYPYDLKLIPQSTLAVKFNMLPPENVAR